MILNIRGASGAGKTWLARRLMEKIGLTAIPTTRQHPEKPQRTVRAGHRTGNVFFVGSYDATCGGCDKLSWKGAADWTQELIADQAMVPGCHVVFEGLMVQAWKATRLKSLENAAPLEIILLDTPLEQCLEAVRQRRYARGVVVEMDPSNTAKKHHQMQLKMRADRAAGLSVHHLDREAAYAFACEKLGL